MRFKKRNFYAPLKFVAGADAQADEWQGGAESREAVALQDREVGARALLQKDRLRPLRAYRHRSECRQFDLSCGRGDRRG